MDTKTRPTGLERRGLDMGRIGVEAHIEGNFEAAILQSLLPHYVDLESNYWTGAWTVLLQRQL